MTSNDELERQSFDVDTEALNSAQRIMQLMYGPMPVGGSCQLLAQIQCEIISAMNLACSKQVKDS